MDIDDLNTYYNEFSISDHSLEIKKLNSKSKSNWIINSDDSDDSNGKDEYKSGNSSDIEKDIENIQNMYIDSDDVSLSQINKRLIKIEKIVNSMEFDISRTTHMIEKIYNVIISQYDVDTLQ